jgi:hypothetical protein
MGKKLVRAVVEKGCDDSINTDLNCSQNGSLLASAKNLSAGQNQTINQALICQWQASSP